MQSFVVFILVAAALQSCFSLPAPASSTTPAKRFTVNLDLPPEKRWSEVVAEYHDDFYNLLQEVKKLVPAEALSLLSIIGQNVETYISYPYSFELLGIAEAIKGVSVGDVILGNTLYEITAFSHKGKPEAKACTSIVAEAVNGTIYHGRNLDYSMSDLLRNMTIIVDFQQGGKTVYTGTTFAGYIGLLTGQKPHAYTITLDERDQGQIWMNAFEALVAGTHGIVGFHIRDTLANPNFGFEDALLDLAYKRIIAPCYIIIGGVKPREGAVITRDREAALDIWRIDAEKGQWYVVETNYDRWLPPPDSDNRRDPAIKAMNTMTRGGLTPQHLYDVMSTPPVLNNGTTYTVIMSASNPSLYNAWIRRP